MATQRDGQRWVLDALISFGGWDVLHPDVGPFFAEIGYNAGDIARVFDQVKSTMHIVPAFATVAKEVEAKAKYWQRRGHNTAAANLYHRASVLNGRVFYSFFRDDTRRKDYQRHCVRNFNAMAKLKDQTIERVRIPFGGKNIYGIFEAPKGAHNAPCVVLIPGMDMFKEDWHGFIERHILPRGWCALAIDGPGQGESLTYGLKVTHKNYELAAEQMIDWVVKRKEINPRRLGLFGISMGSYWGSRVTAHDRRIKATVTGMACYGAKHIIFNIAQPNFKSNFMYMAGINDEAAFNKFANELVLNASVAKKICQPILFIQGEFDELTTLEDSFAFYKNVPAPKEFWTYGQEFHPIGPPSQEWVSSGLDWLDQALRGKLRKTHRKEIYVTRSGEYNEGSAAPPWW